MEGAKMKKVISIFLFFSLMFSCLILSGCNTPHVERSNINDVTIDPQDENNRTNNNSEKETITLSPNTFPIATRTEAKELLSKLLNLSKYEHEESDNYVWYQVIDKDIKEHGFLGQIKLRNEFRVEFPIYLSDFEKSGWRPIQEDGGNYEISAGDSDCLDLENGVGDWLDDAGFYNPTDTTQHCINLPCVGFGLYPDETQFEITGITNSSGIEDIINSFGEPEVISFFIGGIRVVYFGSYSKGKNCGSLQFEINTNTNTINEVRIYGFDAKYADLFSSFYTETYRAI